jgi:hypothetical protein
MSDHPDLYMKDDQDLGIPVRVPIGFFVVFMSQGHNIWAGADFDRILRLAHIVGSIVDPKNFVCVHTIGYDRDAVTFCVGERVLITIIRNVVVACQ